MTSKRLSDQTTLKNWRTAPFNSWSFVNVESLLNGQSIPKGSLSLPWETTTAIDLENITLPNGQSAKEAIHTSHGDALVVVDDGKLCSEFYFGETNADSRHLLFSITKSVVGILAGILIEEGSLSRDLLVTQYIPELANSAWGDATVDQVLDMLVSVDFGEDYLDPQGLMEHYRVAMEWNPPGNVDYSGGLHRFLTRVAKGKQEHGQYMQYASPTTDVLGWILERASGESIPTLISSRIWQRIGAQANAWISVDKENGARTAGGMCATALDLARFGEALRLNADAQGSPFISPHWREDILLSGNRNAWKNGTLNVLFPAGHYRNKWYVPDRLPGAMMAIGIHGQWLYIDPIRKITIVKLSSQPLPEDGPLDQLNIDLCSAVSEAIVNRRSPNVL